MMTKFDWNEMRRAKFERQQREAEFKDFIKSMLASIGGFSLFALMLAVMM